MIDLNEVAVFIKVIQSGSFRAAAKVLGMPNSTVSSKVSQLEKRLGVTLIQRTTRKLNITSAGEAYYKKCLQGIEEIDSAEQEINSLKGEPTGVLRLTAPTELGGSVLPGLIAEYTKKYPKVSVEIILTDRKVDLLGEGVDLAIRAGHLKDSSLVAKRLGMLHFSLFASPKYLKSKDALRHPKDIPLHQSLHFSPLGALEWRLENGKSKVNISLRPKVIVNDLGLLRAMAVSGEGVAFLPSYFCLNEIKSGKLIRILPDWRSDLTPVHFVYPGQKFVNPKLSAFISVATEILKKSFQDF